MKITKHSLPLVGWSVCLLLISPLATAETMMMDHSSMDMSEMNHSSMGHGDMDHSSMDMSGMDHSSMGHGDMDMSGMQGGEPPADARSPDYSNGVGYGEHSKPMMMGSAPLWGVSVSDLGYDFEEDTVNYEADAWYGTDASRLSLRSEGSVETEGDNAIDSLTSVAQWAPMGVFWNREVGVAYDTKTDRPALMAGITGTAPYFIETDARSYFYTDGQVRLNLGAEYEWRLDQHWVVLPEVELTAFAKDDADNHITRGFNDMEAKVRVSYETLSRQFAPYVGVSYETALGSARARHREAHAPVDTSSVIAGVKFWF